MVIDQLLQLGTHQIFVVSSKVAFLNSPVVVTHGDFRCRDQLTAAFDLAEPDLILHLAAVITKDLSEAYMMNVAPAVHLLDLIKHRNVKTRVVLIGSAAE